MRGSRNMDQMCQGTGENKTKITGQQSSKNVTPNGISAIFNEYGIIETRSVSNMIDETTRKMYEELFGGK